MRRVRWFLLLALLAMSLAVTMHHFGLTTWSCERGCGSLAAWVPSKVIALIGLAGVLCMVIAQARREEAWFRALAIVGVTVGLGLIPFMLNTFGPCWGCLAVDAGLVAVALTLVPWKSAPIIASGLFALLEFFLVWAWYDEAHVIPLVEFQARPWEQNVLKAPISFAIFGDPECPACRASIKKVNAAAKGKNIGLAYRWYLIAGRPDSSLKAAIAIEAVASLGPQAAEEYMLSLADGPTPLSKAALASAAKDEATRLLVLESFGNPSGDILKYISSDGKMAKTAGISSVPAYFSIGDPDPKGIRRLVPLSEQSLISVLTKSPLVGKMIVEEGHQ